jgi:hypothetical protein
MFRWGVSDLLRGRVTPTYGYVRQQAEAVALVRLFRSEPGVAHEWYNIRTDAQGRKFHRDHGPKLMALLQQFSGLREAYDKGSSDALHVRIPALLRGFNTSRRPDGNVEFVLLDREVKPEKTEWFLSALDYFLCLQPRLVYELWRGFPETPQDVFPRWPGWHSSPVPLARRWLSPASERIRTAYGWPTRSCRLSLHKRLIC